MIDVALGRDDVGSRCRADRSEETLVMRGLPAHAGIDDYPACVGGQQVRRAGPRRAVDEVAKRHSLCIVVGVEQFAARALVDQSVDFVLNAHFTSFFAVELHEEPSSTPVQMEHWLRMIAKSVVDADRYTRVWQEQVMPLGDRYAMNP